MATKLQRINRRVEQMTHAASALYGGDIFRDESYDAMADIDVPFHLDAMQMASFLDYVRAVQVHKDHRNDIGLNFIRYFETLGEAASYIEDSLSTPKLKDC